MAITPSNQNNHLHSNGRLIALALGALGVVYGDIGTSPLYSVRECFHGQHAIALNPTNVLGVLSLVFWSLTVVITVKYVGFIMKVDNRGEGGIFALLALLLGTKSRMSQRKQNLVILAAVFGATLLYGDGIITPAISVLSAVEGLEVATAATKPIIVPADLSDFIRAFFLAETRDRTYRPALWSDHGRLVCFNCLAGSGFSDSDPVCP